MSAETAAITRRLGAGFNEHIRLHRGPAGDYAGEPVETGDGHGLVITASGVQYAVQVERVRLLHEPGPLTPGQCWAALKAHLTGQLKEDRETHQKATEAGNEATAEAFGYLISASKATLAKMQELESSR